MEQSVNVEENAPATETIPAAETLSETHPGTNEVATPETIPVAQIEPVESEVNTDAVTPTESLPVVEQQQQAQAPAVSAPEPDPKEAILAQWYESGKREVSTHDLISADFDREKIHPLIMQIGNFRLYRVLTLSPYKLEKIA